MTKYDWKASDVTLQGSADGEVGGASLVPPTSPRPADESVDELLERYEVVEKWPVENHRR